MSEPRTEAGRALLNDNAFDKCDPPCFQYVQAAPDTPPFAERILAIEQEALAAERQRTVREIRGRLFEAAWRRDGREWLDPKVTSAILDAALTPEGGSDD